MSSLLVNWAMAGFSVLHSSSSYLNSANQCWNTSLSGIRVKLNRYFFRQSWRISIAGQSAQHCSLIISRSFMNSRKMILCTFKGDSFRLWSFNHVSHDMAGIRKSKYKVRDIIITIRTWKKKLTNFNELLGRSTSLNLVFMFSIRTKILSGMKYFIWHMHLNFSRFKLGSRQKYWDIWKYESLRFGFRYHLMNFLWLGEHLKLLNGITGLHFVTIWLFELIAPYLSYFAFFSTSWFMRNFTTKYITG